MRRSGDQPSRGRAPEEAATVRFVMTSDHDGLVAVDCVVVDSRPGGHLPPPGHPTTLPLLLPEPRWMSDSLRRVLDTWAAADAVVAVRITPGRATPVVRLVCDKAAVSLALAGT